MNPEYVTRETYESERAALMKRGGGPAFPVLDTFGNALYGGMTLRDYFAAAALQGLLAQDGMSFDIGTTAYKYADAMLKARNA